MTISIDTFSGIAPRIANRNLPNDKSQIADNCRLISTGLRAFADKSAIIGNALRSGGDVQSIFHMTSGGNDYWLSWLSDVNCARSAIAGDTTQRIYWTGDNEPRTSDLALAIVGGAAMPNSAFVLGVSAPLVAPTVTPSGGSGAADSRAYVETFVTPWGEESAPSPVSAVTTGKVDDTWALTGLNAAPINSSNITGAVSAGGITTITTNSTAHLRAGEELVHAGILGMTDLNGNFVILSVTDATHYTVSLTTAQVYTSGGTWSRVAPHNTTGMTRRIYRTLSGSYFFVAEIAVGTTTYNDTILDAALGEEIPSIGWLMPDAGLQGFITLPNGISAGFVGNEVCLSEPYRPHAWPSAYRQACNFDVVSIAGFGASIAVGTKGVPYVLTGSHPSNISMEKTELAEPCLSKRGMVDIGIGVAYPSPNGMAFVGVGGAKLITESLFSKDEWALLNPSTLRCNFHNGMLFGWHDINADLHTGFAFDVSSGSFASTSIPTTASYVDELTNRMYVVSSGVLYEWDAHPYNDLTFDWKSKVYSLPHPVNFAVGQVDADFGNLSEVNAAIAADLAYNLAILANANTDAAGQDTFSKGTIDANMLDQFMLDGGMMRGGAFPEYTTLSLRVTVYADGAEKYSENVMNGKLFSLPSGFKATNWEFRISGNLPVYSLRVAESASRLRQMQ